jgi:ribonuclease J
VNEYDLEKEIARKVGSSDGLVLASFSPQHVDRLVCFIRAAQRTHRTFVADVYTAYVMYLIQSEVNIPPPTQAEGIRIFYPQHFMSRHESKRKIHDLFLADRITLDEILTEPASHIMLFRTSMLDSDFGGKMPEKTLCLFSRWEGYLEQSEWKQTREKLEVAGGELALMHTSGHAFVDDLKAFVGKVNPTKTVPMHTFEPEALRDHFSNVATFRDGETFEV